MPYPVFAAGQRLTAATLSAVQPTVAVMTADQSLTNSTTFTNVTELTFPLAANARYLVEVVLHVSGSTTGDLKTRWSLPVGATGLRLCMGPATGSTDRTNTSMLSAAYDLGSSQTAAYGTSSTSAGISVLERGTLSTANAGTWQLQFAQNTIDATNATRIFNSSYVVAWRIT